MRVSITFNEEDVKFALTEYLNAELETYFDPCNMEVTLYKNGKAVVWERPDDSTPDSN